MAAKRSERKAKSAICDYCAADLGCSAGSIGCKRYWRLGDLGLHACDACLARAADDFPDMKGDRRAWALRLRYAHGVNVEMIVDMVKRAGREIVPEQTNIPVAELNESFELFAAGERLAAMYAAKAAWNTANTLNNLVRFAPDIAAGRGTREGGRKGSEASRKTRRGTNSKRAKILGAQAGYKGGDAAKVATIARKVHASPQYIRRVLKQTGN